MHERLKKILLLVVVSTVFVAGYELVHAVNTTGIMVTTAVDQAIPIIDFFVIFYLLYFPFLLIPAVLFWKDYQAYKTTVVTYLAILLISFAFYVLVPTMVHKPPIEPTNLFRAIISHIYQTDPPVNVLPSLHVSLSLVANFLVIASHRKRGLLLAPLMVLIVLSTMFIKQHAILDVIAGLVLAVAVFSFRHPLTRHAERLLSR